MGCNVILLGFYKMISKKVRRHSGRKIAKIYHPKDCPYEFEWWSDWDDYRDSSRSPTDKTKLRKVPKGGPRYWNGESYDFFEREKYNKKIKKQVKIRKAQTKKFINIRNN